MTQLDYGTETPTAASSAIDDEVDVEILMKAINETRLRVWQQQPDSFFDEAVIDAPKMPPFKQVRGHSIPGRV